ncbi:MAG: L,D-transpeptidase family protein [Bacteroidetes bacterium]|nr:L,D-transpeptidase family protein [Bacteroidota bacterium]
MRTSIYLLIFTAVFLSCKGETSLSPTAVIDSIVVKKDTRMMYVFEHGKLLKTYRIALGLEPKGRKHIQGDMRTPEGLYRINNKNPFSDYHKNLGISYPNAADKANATKLGKSPGGDVKIHGLPKGQGYIGSAHRLKDWTHGCIAITNEEIDELYSHVSVGIPINILP